MVYGRPMSEHTYAGAATFRHFYIDPPTIPAGMSVSAYRRARVTARAKRVSGIRRIGRKAMVV